MWRRKHTTAHRRAINTSRDIDGIDKRYLAAPPLASLDTSYNYWFYCLLGHFNGGNSHLLRLRFYKTLRNFNKLRALCFMCYLLKRIQFVQLYLDITRMRLFATEENLFDLHVTSSFVWLSGNSGRLKEIPHIDTFAMFGKSPGICMWNWGGGARFTPARLGLARPLLTLVAKNI